MTEYRFKTIYIDDDAQPFFRAIICCTDEHWQALLGKMKKVADDNDTIEVGVGNSNEMTVDVQELIDQLEDAVLVDEGHFHDLVDLLGDDANQNDDGTCLWFGGAGAELPDLDFWDGYL